MIFKRYLKADRRRTKRHGLASAVEILSGSVLMDGLGVNLSDRGMCLFTIANLAVGSEIEVRFLPPWSKTLVRCSGVVRHRALYLYGIEFLAESKAAASSWAKREPASLPV